MLQTPVKFKKLNADFYKSATRDIVRIALKQHRAAASR